MNAIWMRSRAELRTRLGSIVALAIIVGLVGGVVIAAVAGARRTITAYPRLLHAKNAMDLVVDVTGRNPDDIRKVITDIKNLDGVGDSAEVRIAKGYLKVPGRKKRGDVFALVSPDGFGSSLNGPKIIQGHMADPSSTDEIVPSFAVANDLGLHVGETVQLRYGGIFYQGSSDPNFAEPDPVPLHVVGIGAYPNMFQPLAGGYVPGVVFSPGFATAHPDYMPKHDYSLGVVLKPGVGAESFRQRLLQMQPLMPEHTRAGVSFTTAGQTVGVQQTTRAQSVALWILALLVAVSGLAVFGQALARQTFLESMEYPTLRSLGVTPNQLLAVGMIRAAAIGIVGAVIAGVVGYLLSPLTPTGVARLAEPNPGLAFDGLVVGFGAVIVFLLVTLIGALPAWRAATAKGTALGTTDVGLVRNRSFVTTVLRSFRPSGRAGIRMALEPGAGRTAVPVRTATFGAAISLVAVAASLVFGASLDRLVTKPALSGWAWDTIMFPATASPKQLPVEANRLGELLDKNPAVTAYSIGSFINGRIGDSGSLTIEAMEPRKGSIQPALIEGRQPVGLHEVALGTDTMHQEHASIGSTVTLVSEAGAFPMRVVGRIAIPNVFFSFSRPGQGAAVSVEAALRLSPTQGNPQGAFVSLKPETNDRALLEQLQAELGDAVIEFPRTQSAQLNTLNQVGQTPFILAGVLAVMAMATLAHVLITSIRRRRLDFAILKTLGFVRWQVSGTVAWQATTFGALALVIGIPLGVIVGRWGWNVFADHLGVVPEAVVPTATVLLIVPATILVANLLSLVPGRIASRLRPGPVLRTE
jgi:ABC-type lipoprotein release transport system permease subunit